MPALSPRKVIKKLRKLGFVLDHTTSSHYIYHNSQTKKRTTVPFHIGDLKPGTLAAIIREAGISREEFLAV